MKATTLALLGCACASGWASAQSSVSLYGIVGASVSYTDYRRDAGGNVIAVDNGGEQTSRFGLRGREDLGNGLSAFFQLESGFSLDTGTLLYNGRLFGRQALVGLDSKTLGTLAVGRIVPFSGGAGAFDMWRTIDPFKTGYVLAGQNGSFSAGGIRLDNAIAYRTPAMGGFQAGLMVSAQSASAPLAENPGSDNNNRALATGLSYTGGPWYLALTYDLHKPAQFSTGALAGRAYPAQKMLQLGATYDARLVKLHAAYSRQQDHSLYSPIAEERTVVSTLDPLARPDADTYMVGLTVPVGQANWLFSYRVRDGKPFRVSAASTFEADRDVYGVAYVYWLSKRSRVYTAFASSHGKGAIAPGTDATDTYNRREARIGFNHNF